jgi:hypothetical protein
MQKYLGTLAELREKNLTPARLSASLQGDEDDDDGSGRSRDPEAIPRSRDSWNLGISSGTRDCLGISGSRDAWNLGIREKNP